MDTWGCREVDPYEKLLTRLERNEMLVFIRRTEIGRSYNNSDVDAFRKFMNRILEENTLERRVLDAELTIDLTSARCECIKQVALQDLCYEEESKIIMEVLIKEYDLDLSDEFMKKLMEHSMRVEMLEFFHEYVDLKKYPERIKGLFDRWCFDYITVEHIGILEDIGINVMKLCNETINDEYHRTILSKILHNRNEKFFIYLLEHGINYKKYEPNIIFDCVAYRLSGALLKLIEIGADISVLKNFKNKKSDSSDIKMYNLLEDLDIDPMTIALLLTNQLIAY